MKVPKHCDINLDEWKKYLLEIKLTTNSRWLSSTSIIPNSGNFIIPNRKYLPKPAKDHHGIWIAEIPFQMISRFTKKTSIVWSIFGGSGVDYEVSNFLGRQCIINDIVSKKDYIIEADTRAFNPKSQVDMILAHPPYWDIVKYNNIEGDGSYSKTLEDFLNWWNDILNNVDKYLNKDGYFILACGNLYKNSEEIELGEILKNMVLKRGYILKQHIIKDYGETKGSSGKNYNINYYRQLKGGYGNFYGDNIYVLRKQKSKNNISDIIKKFI